MTFDPYAPDFVENPYPVFAELRARGPAFFDEQWGLTFFSHHRDVKAMLRDRRFGRDVRHAVATQDIDPVAMARIYPSQYPMWTKYIRESFIDFEPPDHTRLRRLVQRAFSRRASESYRASLELAATQLLDHALEAGEIDGIADYATPIPLAMIADLMGIPAQDHLQLVDWSSAIVRLYDQACTAAEGSAAEAATTEFVDYVRILMGQRRTTPGDDLITALIEAEVDGDRLDDDEVIATSILALNAGHEATVQAIGNGLLALARNPDQFAALRANPAGIGRAIDELLRYDTPLQMFERWVLEDMDWNGVPLRRGTKVGLLFGSANHDEAVFERAEELDLARPDNDHISFGGGIHHCVGAPLAKVEMAVAFGAFAERVTEFELIAQELPRVPSLVFRGVKQLPLRVR